MHKLLARQVRRHLGPVEQLPLSWEALLSAVSEAYEHSDKDRSLLERSMDLVSEELLERNRQLRDDIVKRISAEQALTETQSQLLEVSRQAGMAEVATAILHDIGNVLNSANVSSIVLEEKLRGSKVTKLTQVLELLHQHEKDLGPYLTSDPKGKLLPPYLRALFEQMQAEREGLLQEVQSLKRNIDHIKSIVNTQQAYAKKVGVEEQLYLKEVITDALAMNSCSRPESGILVEREDAELPVLCLDKHRVMQVLVNLISNARHALWDSKDSNKVLRIRSERWGEARVRISVIDNGVGISKENMARIFEHGFTTKENGHGFGLHSSANAAKEMAGALSCHSPGPQCGATFILELPFRPARVIP